MEQTVSSENVPFFETGGYLTNRFAVIFAVNFYRPVGRKIMRLAQAQLHKELVVITQKLNEVFYKILSS